jgi:integrase
VFLFSCYTGLAYVDAKKLSNSNIQKGIGGQLWININRTKTDSPTRLPLLPVALEIMNKYKDHPRCIELGTIMPVPTNQKVNEYLKEIATLCNIEKKLTFHIARHTFVTTVTLNNGVPIESVSKMLGHSSVKQTQHYAKIQDHKVSHDMLTLTQRLNHNTTPSCYPLELKNTIEIKNYRELVNQTRIVS